MFDPNHLRQIERANWFHYPPTFWERWPELAALAKTESFQTAYPGAYLVTTNDEVQANRRTEPDLPADLIPFMVVEQKQLLDFYGFQVPLLGIERDYELPVVVWSEHAYVHGWYGGFGDFLNELLSQLNH